MHFTIIFFPRQKANEEVEICIRGHNVVCLELATGLHFIICHIDGEVKRPCK